MNVDKITYIDKEDLSVDPSIDTINKVVAADMNEIKEVVNNNADILNDMNIKSMDALAIGTVVAFAGETIPTGWLECNGASITQQQYPELYDLIGGTLPNLKGKTIVGLDTTDNDFTPIGKTGGEKIHTLNVDEIPSHLHGGLNITGNAITMNGTGSGSFYSCSFNDYNVSGNAIYTDNTGGSQPHNNLQPYAVYKWIIKAKNTTPTMASVVDAYSESTTDAYSCNYVNNNFQPNGIVLFENASGVMTPITITNDTINNYKYIDIYNDIEVLRIFKLGYCYASASFYTDRFYCAYCVYQITESANDLIITPRNSGQWYDNTNHNYDNKTYKVIGYK